MNELYPLTFETIFKDKIWGGSKIKTILGKDFSPLPNCGETWEVSGVEGNVSVVRNGPLAGKKLTELIDLYGEKLLGGQVYRRFGKQFPLLVKFIDANDDLSIQVHPDDKLAQQRHNSFGKTEMWFVIQADEGARLISGFNRSIDKQTYLEYFQKGRLTELLNQERVYAEDTFFIPAGRVHTIGKGILLAEVQQTSDITYRIYDFDRVDASGRPRELHVEEALDAIDYKQYNSYKTQYKDKPNAPVQLAECEYFRTNKLKFDQPIDRNYEREDSFVIYICYSGSFDLEYNGAATRYTKGDVILLPAQIKAVKLTPAGECKILESLAPVNYE